MRAERIEMKGSDEGAKKKKANRGLKEKIRKGRNMMDITVIRNGSY